jgi:3-deoxy-D-manno-octulosonic-acid transferase
MAFGKQELDDLLFAQNAVLIVHSDAFEDDILDALALRVEDEDPDLQVVWAPLSAPPRAPKTLSVPPSQVTPQGTLRMAPRSVAEYKCVIDHLKLRALLFLGCTPSAAALVAARTRGIPIATAQLKRRDIPKQRRFSMLSSKMMRLRSLDMIFTVDAADAIAHDVHLPLSMVKHCADMRLSRATPAVPPDHFAAVQPKLMHRSIWVATDVTRGDMRHILAAHRHVLRRDFRALLILAPRDHRDITACKAYIYEAQLSFACVADTPCPDDQTHIWLDDTGNAAALWHHLAQSSCVGGSFDDTAMPADITPIIGYGSAVIYGPKLGSFQNNVTDLVRLGAARQVSDADALANAVTDLSNVDMSAAQTVAAWEYSTQADAAMGEVAHWLITPKPKHLGKTGRTQDKNDENTRTLVS